MVNALHDLVDLLKIGLLPRPCLLVQSLPKIESTYIVENGSSDSLF